MDFWFFKLYSQILKKEKNGGSKQEIAFIHSKK